MGIIARSIVVGLFLASLLVMVADYVFGINKIEITFFYVCCNAILILRVFGISVMTWLVHVLAFVGILIVFFMLDYKKVNLLHALTLVVATALTFIAAILLLVVDPGNTACKKACHAGLHAFMGLLTAILYFLIVAFAANYNDVQCILEMVYFLLFVIMVLMPSFRTSSHAVKKAQDECERLQAALGDTSIYGDSSICSDGRIVVCSRDSSREGVRHRRRHLSAHSRMSAEECLSGSPHRSVCDRYCSSPSRSYKSEDEIVASNRCSSMHPPCDRYCTSAVRVTDKDGQKTYHQLSARSLEEMERWENEEARRRGEKKGEKYYSESEHELDRRQPRSISKAARSSSRARSEDYKGSPRGRFPSEGSQSSEERPKKHRPERDVEPQPSYEETPRRSRSKKSEKRR